MALIRTESPTLPGALLVLDTELEPDGGVESRPMYEILPDVILPLEAFEDVERSGGAPYGAFRCHPWVIRQRLRALTRGERPVW